MLSLHPISKAESIDRLLRLIIGRDMLQDESEVDDVLRLLHLSVGRILSKNLPFDFYEMSIDVSTIYSATDCTAADLQHVVDWLVAAIRSNEHWLSRVDEDGRPKKLMKFSTIAGMTKEADKAMMKANQKLSHVILNDEDEEFEFSLADGFYIVRMLTPEALDRESKQMQHCIGQGAYDHYLSDDLHRFWSLRDRHGNAHATIHARFYPEINRYISLQISGKQNMPPILRYARLLGPFLVENNIDFSNTEKAFDELILCSDGQFFSFEDLPENSETFSALRINGESLSVLEGKFRFPKGLRVRGNLIMDNVDLSATKMPDLIGGDLHIFESCHVMLPDDFRVGGNLTISDCTNVVFGSGLSVEGGFELRDVDVEILPERLSIGGSLTLAWTAITELPDDIVFGDSLTITKTPLSALPARRITYDKLEIERTNIRVFPAELHIGSRLLISDNVIDKNVQVVKSANKNVLVSFINVTADVAPLADNLTMTGSTFKSLPTTFEASGALQIIRCDIEKMPQTIRARNLVLSGQFPSMPKSITLDGMLTLMKTGDDSLPSETKLDIGSLHLNSVNLQSLHPDIKDDTEIIHVMLDQPTKRMSGAEFRRMLEDQKCDFQESSADISAAA